MKKQLLTMLAVCAASCAWAAEVYSDNTVGYTRVAVAPGNNLLGAQFVEVGTDAALDINDLVTPATDLPGLNDTFEAFQTTLMTWTGSGYAYYGLCAVGQGVANGMDEWDGKWLTSDMNGVAVLDIPAGQGFWIQTSENSTITTMGQVASGDTTSVEIASGVNLISCPYPKAINIQDVVPSTDLPGLNDTFEAFQTTLMMWTGSGYTYYGLCAVGQGEANGMPEWDGKWLTSDMNGVADVEIPAGQGFWIQTSGTGTVTFTK